MADRQTDKRTGNSENCLERKIHCFNSSIKASKSRANKKSVRVSENISKINSEIIEFISIQGENKGGGKEPYGVEVDGEEEKTANIVDLLS